MGVWFRNIRTGVAWDIEGERALDIARINKDLEEIGEDAPEEIVAGGGKVEVSRETDEESTEDVLDAMEKKDLIAMAKSLDIATSGKNVNQLKEAIRSAE